MRAIIINHNTKDITLLALLSALKYADCPVTLIDCESTDGSYEFFESLNEPFELFQAPLQPHGKTLDRIFRETQEDILLLIDSDVEILNDRIIKFIKKELQGEKVYGAGFFTEGGLFRCEIENQFFRDGGIFQELNMTGLNDLYHPRPWMPLVALKTAPIKQALNANISFRFAMVNNDFAYLPKRFYWMAKKIGLPRKKVCGSRPERIVYDTGGRMHVYLTRRGYRFSGMPETVHREYVYHLGGQTLSKERQK